MKIWVNKEKLTFNVSLKLHKHKTEDTLKRQVLVLGEYIEKRYKLEPFGFTMQVNQMNDDFIKQLVTLHLEYDLI